MRLTAPLPGNGGGAVFVNKAMMKFFKKHWEVLSYLIFGVLTTLLNIVLYALFSQLFGYTAANSWGNVLDNALCILFAYCTNRAFVFRSRTTGKAMAKEFGTFVTCRLGTMVLDAAIMIVGGNLLAAQGAALLSGQRALLHPPLRFLPDTAKALPALPSGPRVQSLSPASDKPPQGHRPHIHRLLQIPAKKTALAIPPASVSVLHLPFSCSS